MLARLTELMTVKVKRRKRARNLVDRDSSPEGRDSMDFGDAGMDC
jgi:hypothetical protein